MPKPSPPSATDIRPPAYWRHLPQSIRLMLLLIRFDRPIGWWLLLLPGWVALPHSARLTASGLGEVLLAMGLFWLGAVVARGAGCIINDLWDRDLDRLTARTKTRPLASGEVSPLIAGFWLIVLTIVGIGILSCLPPAARLTALAATPLVILYPLAKRFLPLPQLILALTFSWAALAGWAVFAGLPVLAGLPFNAPASWLAALLLYGGFAAWVFGYDTIYAIQDLADDKRLAINSSAITFGKRLPLGVALAYSLALLAWGVAAVFMSAGWGFWVALALAAVHLIWQVRRVQGLYSDASNKTITATAGDIFRSNRNLGLILVAGSVGDYCFALAII